MNSNKILWGVAVVALVIATIGVLSPTAVSTLGGTTNFDAITLDSGNLTISNGDISVSKATGTTTVSTLGCINAFATSSATAIRFVFNNQATTSLSGAANGVVAWQYGTCP